MYAERLLVLVLLAACAPAPSKAPPREGGPGTRVLPLTEGWRLQSGALVPEPDSAVASPGYAAAGWLPTQVPTTVSGAHVQAGAHGDPFFGMNLRDLPGVDYPVGEGFGNLPMSAESPYRQPFWFRRDFTLPTDLPGSRLWLRLDGVNYRAAVFVNGHQVADRGQVAGTFRRFDLDISDHVSASGITSVSLSTEKLINPEKLLPWLNDITQARGPDILRLKGIFAFPDEPKRFVVQGVHMIVEGDTQRDWKEGEKRVSRLVFIGKNLDRAELETAFAACAA